MSRIVYLNGQYVPEAEAKISIFDRSVLFADGVYEVTAVIDGALIGFEGHIERLKRSLAELAIPYEVDADALLEIHGELARKNDLTEGGIYLQVTRGAPADRDFLYPPEGTEPTIFLFTQAKPGFAASKASRTGVKICTLPDMRWGRRDIKTVQLLYPSMAKMEAVSQGFDDAWMIEDGHVTEGTSNNAGIIVGDKLITRHLGKEILAGITRAAVLECAAEMNLTIEERAFTLEEALNADEAFISSATMLVTPVVQLDDQPVGGGQPGPVVRTLRQKYLEAAHATAIPIG